MPAQRRPIVEISPPVPSAVPPIFFQRFRNLCCVLPPVRCAGMLAAMIGQRSKCRQRGMKKPAQPYTLSFSANSDSIQTVIPVSGSDERQAVGADGETCFQCTRAMFVERFLIL